MAVRKKKESVNNTVYQETALKHGLSPDQVEEFFKVCCGFTKEVVIRGGFETIMLPNFGKFKVKTKQVQYLFANEILKA